MATSEEPDVIQTPPGGLSMLLLIGPSLVWCAEYIGSGEVILATRTGAVLGTGALWAVVAGVFLKYWIGMSGARYTVCTGEGMIDMLDRVPGPSHWVVWIVMVAQLAAATVAIGSLASAAGVFVASLLPVPPYWGGWLVSIFAVLVVWSGTFEVLKVVMVNGLESHGAVDEFPRSVRGQVDQDPQTISSRPGPPPRRGGG